MVIIADAGSTKIDWAVNKPNGISYYTSSGWNPTQDPTDLQIDDKELEAYLLDCTSLYYYGTGLGSKEGHDRAMAQLKKMAPISDIHVATDLLGAARALFNTSDGITTIIGTGSNVCYYDGQNLQQATPSLGYLLSDEGSGFAIGKSIIKDFFYRRMPRETHELFLEKYTLSKEDLLKTLYHSPRPNAAIAQYTRFLVEVDNEWKNTLLRGHFDHLIKEKILRHKNFLSVPVGFTGSIADIYSDILKEACAAYDIHHTTIIANPIESLVAFHTS